MTKPSAEFIAEHGSWTIDHLQTHSSQFCSWHGVDLEPELTAMVVQLVASLDVRQLEHLKSVYNQDDYKGLVCGDCGHDNMLYVVRCRSCNAPVHTYK